ncbi:glycosyl hydrolase 5 family protein-like [Actinidia eriantha]|uniref:glycosyl hydrolase 5 family protein-like n=1 Tax=Actinidia eriantha TaxID=165200 RepID=UPI00258DB4B4|nr:glycosyl hydrolase 5 family protein-like [Actinidia eriantha]
MGCLSTFSLLPLLSLSILLIPTATQPAVALPLSTDSRWIVDETGRRVKLACVNWVSHLEVVVAEGLSKQPMGSIAKRIGSMGFNCVRLTWPLYLATNESLASLTVRQSFIGLGLYGSISGIQVNNPSIIDLSLINAYQAVVSSLADNNIMVILDNHISTPGWCCGNFDGNGFFGDQYFNPDLWINGLTRMATMFRATPNVVGMSLRNELRGNKQNVNDWYRYMQKGAEAVHAANPEVLVIVSGLNYDRDFSFLLKRPINLTFTRKLVFEVHWYAFSDGPAWQTGNANQVCGQVVDNTMRKAGFVLDQGYPLLVSEFGVDLRGTNVNDNRYLNCFLGVAAELDLDWALWTLVGSYYLREGVIGLDEVYGIFNWNWCDARNSSFLDKISAIQSPFQGPGLAEVKRHKVIFHPSTGLCLIRKSLLEPLRLGPCTESESWSYTQQKTLTIKGTYFCLETDGLDKPAVLSIMCTYPTSKWEQISDSKMHLSSKLDNGMAVCLDIDSSTNAIITSACKCLQRDNMCDPGSQWFKLVDSTMSTGATTFGWFRSVLDYLTRNAWKPTSLAVLA